MPSTARCWTPPRAALVIVTLFSSGCTGVGFETQQGALATCPPVVQYSREVQVRAAEELVLLPEISAIVEMLSDYAVMREQSRLCR